jgi:ApeA N-terminal domain 1
MATAEDTTSDDGLWWLPENPQAQVQGTLTYSLSSGLELQLAGSLFPIKGTPQFNRAFTVWGTTARAKNISLVQAHLSNVRMSLPGSVRTKISAYQGVIGGFYRSFDDVMVHTVSAHFDYLAAWAAQSGISHQHDHAAKRAVITVEAPPIIRLGQSGGIDVTIEPFVSETHSRDGVTLRNDAQLQLRAPTPLSYSEFERLVGSFTRFLTLGVGEPAVPTRIVGDTDTKAQEIEGRIIWNEVEIIRQRTRPGAKEIFREEMLFALQDLGEGSGATLQSFLEAEQQLRPVIDLLLVNYFHPQLPIPQEFLTYLNAIQLFHRTQIGGQYLSDEEYATVKKRLMDALPSNLSDEFRNSLEARLSNLHQYTFRKRVRDVLHRFESVLSQYIPNTPEFLDVVTDLRNSLLYSPDRTPANYTKIWRVSQLLGLVLEVSILCAFGFAESKVKSIIGRGRRAHLVASNVI